MSWVYELTNDAEQDFNNLPQSIKKRVARILKVLEINPFQGDIKSLRGAEWDNAFRRRIGKYRIIFAVRHTEQKISIVRILIRSEKTYR